MNRRAFLYSAGLTAATSYCFFPTILRADEMESGGPYAAGTTAQSALCGHYINGTMTHQDWGQVHLAMGEMITDWQSNNYDSVVSAGAAQLSPADICTGNLNLSAITAAIAQTSPGFTANDTYSLVGSLDDVDASTIQQVLDDLATSGLLPYLQFAQSQAYEFSQPSGGYGNPQAVSNATRCQNHAAGILLATVAFATLAIMAGPAGVLAYAAAANAIALWGGTATAVWGVGQAIGCGF